MEVITFVDDGILMGALKLDYRPRIYLSLDPLTLNVHIILTLTKYQIPLPFVF